MENLKTMMGIMDKVFAMQARLSTLSLYANKGDGWLEMQKLQNLDSCLKNKLRCGTVAEKFVRTIVKGGVYEHLVEYLVYHERHSTAKLIF